MDNEIEIKLLKFPDCIRQRSGMYISSVDNANVLLREVIDNATDEANAGFAKRIEVISDFSSDYYLVADDGRGIPLTMSPDKPGITMAELAVSELHSGSKFEDSDVARVGMNGIGDSAVNAVSERFVLMSRITEENYNKSTQFVWDAWEKAGPRSKRDLYYVIVFERGIKQVEFAGRLGDIEKSLKLKEEVPRGYSTVILFTPDPEIFESTKAVVPVKNIQYFLLIQEKVYRRKVDVIVNGTSVKESFQPYKFEFFRTIVPADTSKNKTVSVYVTFDVDPELGAKQEEGSVSGLVVEQGVHLTFVEAAYEAALKKEFGLTHKYLQNGLRICVILLAGDVVFDSQTKTRLKNISKVKVTDFSEVAKDFCKIFRANREYWEMHVEKLNQYADSMKSFSASDKAKRMIDGNSGNSLYRNKSSLVEGFAEATAPQSERMKCECFLVEGLSPGFSLKSGRKDTRYHAILPLRGKVLNVSDKSTEQMLMNREYSTLFKVIGLGLDIYNVTEGASSPEEAWTNIQKHARYGKICIAVDGDEDGKNIMSGLLYCFSKFARFLIDFGMVYIAEAPIFWQDGKFYYPSDPLQPGTVFPIGLDQSKHFKRYKGLGSLNKEDIYDAYYNEKTRRLIRVTPETIPDGMALVEDITKRKQLLYSAGILSNPYKFNDL